MFFDPQPVEVRRDCVVVRVVAKNDQGQWQIIEPKKPVHVEGLLSGEFLAELDTDADEVVVELFDDANPRERVGVYEVRLSRIRRAFGSPIPPTERS